MTYRYGSARTSTLAAKIEGIPFGQKPGDSAEWRKKFDTLMDALKSLYAEGKITNEYLYRALNAYTSNMTYEQIVGVLQPYYDNAINNQREL